MKKFFATHPRTRAVLAWVALVAAALVLFRWVEPAVFESPYNNF
ncbi:MAG: hypothetical protein RI908_1444 [Actinomycetota bacterium]|jgi:hypothetical protein